MGGRSLPRLSHAANGGGGREVEREAGFEHLHADQQSGHGSVTASPPGCPCSGVSRRCLDHRTIFCIIVV
jgi:hypothetical protein